MRFKLYIFVILFNILSRQAYAQTDLYKFSHLDITNGLSDNQVNCIFKDEKGFVWFGTTSGLDRYDGYQFRIFRHSAKDNHSLSENHVLSIDEGPAKSLWIFTHDGISIYDPETERFENNIRKELMRYHVFTDKITAIKKDNQGGFWFLTKNSGLYRYNQEKQNAEFYSTLQTSKIRLHSNEVMFVTQDDHNFWLLYSDGTIDAIDAKSNKIIRRYTGIQEASHKQLKQCGMMLDNEANLWVYSNATPVGAFCYNTRNNKLSHFEKGATGESLNSNIVNNIVQADDNKIWVGTDHGGINVIDPAKHRVTYLLSREDDPKSLTGNSVELYKDNAGIIWAGTFKQGVNYYRRGILQFPLYKHFTTDKSSLPFEDVNSFAEDTTGNLWIGTNGGGLLYYNRKTNHYTQFKHEPANPNSISSDIVVRLCLDHEHKLWIGTYYGGLDCFDGTKFTHYRHSEKDPLSISDDRVYTIIEDAQKRLWVGTFAGGLNIFDPQHHNFLHPRYNMLSDYTAILFEDKQKNIWIGRDKGVDVIEKKTNTVKHYFYKPDKANSLVGSDVNTILQDSRGLMWIGTKDGLCILNSQTGEFLNLHESIDLPSNNVSNILEDNRGEMWVSTTNGLANIILNKTGGQYHFRINNFNEFDGLQSRGFNLNAALKLKNGELMFGGAHGFNLFNPQEIITDRPKQNLVFTDFRVFNKRVSVGDTINGSVILTKSISDTRTLVLNHDVNVFDIEFAACDYFSPDKIKYQYTLEGFEKGWITLPYGSRKATYTNLDAGDYLFRVRTLDTNNGGDGNSITLKITVLPPFWETPFAFLVYSVVLLSILFYIRHRGILKLKRQFELMQEKIEAERKIESEREEALRMHQLDLMKIKFFTNVSHEFRTPLSLILSPIDDLLKATNKPEQQNHLMMIKRNGKRLLNLVNQLLDFRKMEYNELKLNLKEGDIIQFIKDVCASFTDVAHQKNIQYIFDSEECNFTTLFDQDKIERVLFNLLSNAFKFTPAGGHISVLLSLSCPEISADGGKMLDIKIIDTGIGIAAENHEKIFERFFQDSLPESLLNQGSGIGLSITREFVKMHGGTIKIESEPGYGTCFIISLPVGKMLQQQQPALVPGESVPDMMIRTADDKANKNKKPTILLIEDNDDLRFYLKDNLKNSFHITEAVNGKEGWQKALALHPQLIISDITMPEMNGLELCKKIRADNRTMQLPIILLTALNDESSELSGLDSGANDYIVKPFNFEILLSKIHNLLQMQQAMKETYQKQFDIQAMEVDVVSEDDKFLKNTFECIEKNITNANFSVEQLSKHLNLSRVSLYKKLLTLTGKTPVDCIRTIRLKRAIQLLEKSKLSIANVAYEVGFNNAAYFAKVFREEFGVLPSEFLHEIKAKEKEETLV
jgi:signal transduction histidine kinase/ligand-binding sensor domain-containing protein/DNA-binding response OmpR family regulator